MKYALVAVLSALLLSISCKKNNEMLPAKTKTGANTFGCLLNGKEWVPTGRGAFSGINATSGGFFDEVDNTTGIYVKAYGPSDEIAIYLKNTTSVGTYNLNRNTSIRPNAVLPEASYGMYLMNSSEYVTDSLHTGVVTITHADLTTGIVSGTFNLKVYQKTTGQVLSITDGRFDFKTH